jgi:anti-sigma factor RsiW
MVVSDEPPDLTAEEEADLVAFVDGRLQPDRRARVEARAEKDPAYRAALLQQEVGRNAVVAAAEATGAPLALKTRVEEMGPARGRRQGVRGPSARTRLGGIRWPAGGVVVGAFAVVLAAIVIIGGSPGVEDVAAAAERAPRAAVAPVPPTSKLLHERVADVNFPNYAGKFGWKAVGTRTDEIDGRATRTVFYEKNGKRIGYTVVSGAALDPPGEAVQTTREGTVLWAYRSDGRDIVTWRRRGHTCVLSATGVPHSELLDLAGWKGKGAVAF